MEKLPDMVKKVWLPFELVWSKEAQVLALSCWIDDDDILVHSKWMLQAMLISSNDISHARLAPSYITHGRQRMPLRTRSSTPSCGRSLTKSS